MSDQKIIEFLQQNGPSNPAQVGKHLGIQMLFASAMLGECASRGHVKITKMKVGSSPLYYLEQYKERLIEFKEKLNSKDRVAFDLLESKKVLRDSSLNPITRVSLREIKDFAIPLNIVRNSVSETFWKWYLFSDEEATEKIKEIFSIENPLPKSNLEKSTEANKIAEKAIEKDAIKSIEKNIIKPTDEKFNTTKEDRSTSSVYNDIENSNTSIPIKEQIVSKNTNTNDEKIRDEQTKLSENKLSNNNIEKDIEKEKSTETIKKTERERPLETSLNKKQTIASNTKDSIKISEIPLNENFTVECSSSFGSKLYEFFKTKDFKILHYELENKKSKFTFIIDVPNAISATKYYARALDKKTLNEGDLALVIVEGNQHNLPSILFTTGTISKKIEPKLKSLFKDLIVIKV